MTLVPDRRLTRRLKDTLGPLAVFPQQLALRRNVSAQINAEVATVIQGERWVRSMFWRALGAQQIARSAKSVLVVGCGSGKGDDLRVWLENGLPLVHGCDAYPASDWSETAQMLSARYASDVQLIPCPGEALSVAESSYDIVYSTAVLEHVKDVAKVVSECARVQTPSGMSCHSIGPLYYSHGGDHCSSSYGLEHGYDHLLLSRDEYDASIWDEAFFAKTSDPHQAGWARSKIFSFAEPDVYLRAFNAAFTSVEAIAVLSPDGLLFRARYPEKWAALRAAGHSEDALLIKSLIFVAAGKRSQQEP